MRSSIITVIGTIALAMLAGCEKRTRTRNSSGSSGLFEEGATATTNVYRFVGVEQTLGDARKAVQDEDWGQALAATDSLLKQQPANSEAKALNQQARLEAPNLVRYHELGKAAAANEVSVAMRQYRAIAENSMYRERARPMVDNLKQSFVDNQVNDTRALVRAGRCDDARRVAKATSDWFPDVRVRVDDAASGCRPAKGSSAPAVARAELGKAEPEPQPEPEPRPEDAKTTPIAMAAPAPPTLAMSDVEPRPAALSEGKTLAALVPTSAPAGARVMAPAPLPGAPISLASRNVPISELEPLRVTGDPHPSLPAGAKMIMNRDNVKRITVAVKLCLSDQGAPTSVTFVKSSDYGDANEKILSEIRKWRFRPYLHNGNAVPVCTASLLNYQLQ